MKNNKSFFNRFYMVENVNLNEKNKNKQICRENTFCKFSFNFLLSIRK